MKGWADTFKMRWLEAFKFLSFGMHFLNDRHFQLAAAPLRMTSSMNKTTRHFVEILAHIIGQQYVKYHKQYLK
jgi:hypothetical protein